MDGVISRRTLLASASAAGAAWLFALDGAGNVVRAASNGDTFSPTVLSEEQLEAVARLCETIIPRTDTPGAIDARVHEYIDVRLSGMYDNARLPFLRGLSWLEGRGSVQHGKTIADLDDAQCAALLEPISDIYENPDEALASGAEFFKLLKGWTIHGYYTSRQGRVMTLGLPEHIGMQQWVGCTHSDH